MSSQTKLQQYILYEKCVCMTMRVQELELRRSRFHRDTEPPFHKDAEFPFFFKKKIR